MSTTRMLEKSRKLRRKGAHARALSLMIRTCETHATVPELWVEQAITAQELQDLRTAAHAWFRAGELYLKAGAGAEARSLIHRALALDPGHPGARQLLSVVSRERSADPVEEEEDDDPAEVLIEVIELPEEPKPETEAERLTRETRDFRRATAIASAILASEHLQRLDSDMLLELSRRARLIERNAGQEIFVAGDPAESLFLVTEGEVRVRVAGIGRWSYGVGEVVGVEALLGTPLLSSAVAGSECALLELPMSALRELDRDQEGLLERFWLHGREALESVCLYAHPLCAHCDDEAREALLDVTELRRVEADQTLLSQGERPGGLFIIVDGRFRMIQTAAGEQRLAGHLGNGDLAGAGLVLSGGEADASVIAETSSWVLFIPRRVLTELVARFPLLLEVLAAL